MTVIPLSTNNLTPNLGHATFYSPNSIKPMQSIGKTWKVGLGLSFVAITWIVLGCADNSLKIDQVELISKESTPTPLQRMADPVSVEPATLPPDAPLGPAVLHQNLSIGAQLLGSGQFLDAEIVLRAVLKEQPNCARAEFLLGVALMKQKQYAKARPLLEESLARKQDFSGRKQVDHFLGWACFYLGDLESSKRYFQSHVGSMPTADDSYYGLAVIAIEEDRISDAQVALERAMELIGTAPARNKDRAKMLARLGDIELRREKTVEALALYEEAVTLWPDHYEVWGKLARVYDTLNRTTDADQSRAKQQEAMKRTGREFVGDSAP